MMKTIVVKGAYGDANFGDDALMCTIENFFIENNLNLNVTFCGNTNGYCERFLERSEYLDISGGKSLPADLLIYGGGTQFFLFNSNKGNFYLRFFLRLLKQDPKLLILKVRNKLFGKKMLPAEKFVGLGLGLGPFNPENDRLEYIKSLVRRMDLLFVRDKISLSYCRDWDCNNVNEGADICYSRFLNYQLPVGKGREESQTNKQRKRIGVIVRDWKHNEEGNGFRQALLDIVDSPEYAGYEFTFIVFSDLQDLEWKGIINDRKYALLRWDPFRDQINDFLDTLNGFDGFITARYHGGVFASLLNKPAVCIAIEPKLNILSEQIKGFTLWDKPFRPEGLKAAMKVFDNSDFDCSASVNSLKRKADAMFDSLHQYLREL